MCFSSIIKTISSDNFIRKTVLFVTSGWQGCSTATNTKNFSLSFLFFFTHFNSFDCSLGWDSSNTVLWIWWIYTVWSWKTQGIRMLNKNTCCLFLPDCLHGFMWANKSTVQHVMWGISGHSSRPNLRNHLQLLANKTCPFIQKGERETPWIHATFWS